jgi:hypothetical protein
MPFDAFRHFLYFLRFIKSPKSSKKTMCFPCDGECNRKTTKNLNYVVLFEVLLKRSECQYCVNDCNGAEAVFLSCHQRKKPWPNGPAPALLYPGPSQSHQSAVNIARHGLAYLGHGLAGSRPEAKASTALTRAYRQTQPSQRDTPTLQVPNSSQVEVSPPESSPSGRANASK